MVAVTRKEQFEQAQALAVEELAFGPEAFDYTAAGLDPEWLAGDGGLGLSTEELLELYEYLDPDEQAQLDTLLAEQSGPESALLPHQLIPWWLDWWDIFALRGGRGTGKTVTGANGVIELIEGQLSALGKSKAQHIRIGIAAPTNVDARDVCMEGETGLMTLFGSEFTRYNRSIGQTEARHKSGAYVRAMGTEKARPWNGPQWSGAWIDEFPLCNPVAIRDMQLGLRLGPKEGPYRARTIVTFTPKTMPWADEFLKRDDVYVPVYLNKDGSYRFPTTFDNPHLPGHRLKKFRQMFEGTRLGLRELYGVEIGGVEGAMWWPELFKYEPDPDKWGGMPRGFVKVVVAIDPAGTAARKKADENARSAYDKEHEIKRRARTAICVLGLGKDGKIYVLAWVAEHWSPNTWATRAVDLYHAFGASVLVGERNFGGDMVESTLRNVWPDAPIEIVVASRGKDQRAERVVGLYEQDRVLHCTVFDKAEAQLCAFKTSDDNEGADYVDCLVWGVYNLMGWKDLEGRGGPVIIHGQHPELMGAKSLNIFVVR